MNKQEIAERYAKNNGFDKAELVAIKEGMTYFQLTWVPHPKYTGHPNIIKISQTGEILIVNDREEKYWAIKQPKL